MERERLKSVLTKELSDYLVVCAGAHVLGGQVCQVPPDGVSRATVFSGCQVAIAHLCDR